MEMLQEINRAGTTVIMVTHSLAHSALAQRTVKLLDGKIVKSAGRELVAELEERGYQWIQDELAASA